MPSTTHHIVIKEGRDTYGRPQETVALCPLDKQSPTDPACIAARYTRLVYSTQNPERTRYKLDGLKPAGRTSFDMPAPGSFFTPQKDPGLFIDGYLLTTPRIERDILRPAQKQFQKTRDFFVQIPESPTQVIVSNNDYILPLEIDGTPYEISVYCAGEPVPEKIILNWSASFLLSIDDVDESRPLTFDVTTDLRSSVLLKTLSDKRGVSCIAETPVDITVPAIIP